MNILDFVKKIDPRHRFQVKKLNDFENMDNELLGIRLRHLTHALDLVTKSEWRMDQERGDTYEKINVMVREWKKRDLPNGILCWVNEVLSRYEKWKYEKKPQADWIESISTKESLWDLLRSRRSVRMFLPKPVENELIEKIIDAARWAPCSCNRQAWKFTVVKEDQKSLLDNSLLEKAPVVILVSVDERPYFNHEKHAPALDVGFATQNMLLAAHSLGLGACPVYYAHSHAQTIRKKVGIKKTHVIYLAMAIGYAAEEPLIPPRIEVNEILANSPKEVRGNTSEKPKTGAN